MTDNICSQIASSNPLILCLTNDVTKNFCANALLACGASPLMSKAVDELPQLLNIAQAVLINIGTLDASFMTCAINACNLATKKSIPIVLDPVGAGASDYRLNSALEIINITENIILKGNASEILALSHAASHAKGVDSGDTVDAAINAAKTLIQTTSVHTVVITGKNDVILSDSMHADNPHGCEMMTRVTGMGCALSACIAAACAVQCDFFIACSEMMELYTLAAQDAIVDAHGPGSFSQQFIDRLYQRLINNSSCHI